MRLYRYRSIERASQEITDGIFHFSSKKELNDPLEGYVQLFWQSDRAAWEGLFRNYICSLMRCLELYLLAADRITLCDNLVLEDIHQFDSMPIRQLYRELGDVFLETESCRALVDLYGGMEISCDSTELEFILRLLHEIAFSMCLQACVDHGFMPEKDAQPFLNQPRHTSKQTILQHARWRSTVGKDSDKEQQALIRTALYTFQDIFESSIIRHSINTESEASGETTEQRRAFLTIKVDFPTLYVSQLKELVYPQGYVVCFSKSGNNSVMWGNYADKHRGVCLIYETDSVDGREIFPFLTSRNAEIQAVEYGGKVISRNFFETFGRLTLPQIRTWLTGTTGCSKSMDAFAQENVEAWRNRYWKDYGERFYKKLGSWEYEAEYRMLLGDMLDQYEDPQQRNLKYDPSTLKGVIFGMRTSEIDKLTIIKDLKKTRNTLKGFEFYQAQFDESSQTIEIRNKAFLENI